MRFSVLFIFLFVLLCGAALAQQPANPAWNANLQPNTTAQSNLSVVNQCRQRHNFEIQKQNVPFLNISQNQVQVNGGQTVNIPAQFNTQNLAPGVHQGQVTVVCLTCRSEPGCTQDREVLQVVLTVATPQNQPNNPPNQNPTTNQPTTNNPPIQTQADWGGIPKEKIPRTVAAYTDFLTWALACPPDCDKLRKAAAEAESSAADAQKAADDAKAELDKAEKKAKDAENAADKAEKAAQPGSEGGTITADGETFSQADSDYLEAKKQKLFDDWRAGKISAEEHQRQRAALSGTDALKKAREERLANEAKLKKDAEAARAAADKARADAEKAFDAAAAAQKKADDAKAAADAALEAYKKCLKELKDECDRISEAKAQALKEQKDREIKAAADAAAADKAKKDKEEAEKTRQAEVTYLLDNIKKLGLISSAPFKDIPGGFDKLIDKIIPDILGKTVEQWVSEMTSQVAEGLSGSPIPAATIQALGGLYQIVAKLLDPCSPLGAPRIVQRLQGMKNPKTGSNYTPNEALDKVDKMCELLKELKAKVEAIKKAAGK